MPLKADPTRPTARLPQAMCCLVRLQLAPAAQAGWLRLAIHMLVGLMTLQLLARLLLQVPQG